MLYHVTHTMEKEAKLRKDKDQDEVRNCMLLRWCTVNGICDRDTFPHFIMIRGLIVQRRILRKLPFIVGEGRKKVRWQWEERLCYENRQKRGGNDTSIEGKSVKGGEGKRAVGRLQSLRREAEECKEKKRRQKRAGNSSKEMMDGSDMRERSIKGGKTEGKESKEEYREEEGCG